MVFPNTFMINSVETFGIISFVFYFHSEKKRGMDLLVVPEVQNFQQTSMSKYECAC